MSTAREAITVRLEPGRAFDLWTDLTRWATFVDGFGHADRVDDTWPTEGAKLVWRSVPAGRGLVTERVVVCEPGERFVTQFFDERTTGAQALRFEAVEDGSSTRVDMELDYRLQKPGPFGFVTDALFIRRAQTDAIRRTLRRFATEAAEEAAPQPPL